MQINKKQIFLLLDWQRQKNAAAYLAQMPLDGTYEVEFRLVKKDKTMKQLGAMFGVWVKFLSDELAESEDYIHRMLKAKFLARIYVIDPMTPAQDQWVELLVIYQEFGAIEKLERHAKRISLSWAKLSQMKEYMRAVENHYQAEGMPLPVIDKYWKFGQK